MILPPSKHECFTYSTDNAVFLQLQIPGDCWGKERSGTLSLTSEILIFGVHMYVNLSAYRLVLK